MFLLLLSLIVFPPHPRAEGAAPADSVVILPEITVTATRTPPGGDAAPARVMTLDREDVRASASRSVAELLAARSTGFIRRYGSGGLATLSLRGASPGQTLLLVDGLRLSDPQTGQIDLALLPTILLDDVEIVHGAGSALYGSDGVAGVVNLRTARFDTPGSLALRAAVGAFGERSVGLRVGQAMGRWQAGIAAEAVRADGDFLVPSELVRGTDVRREGADRAQASLFATVRRDGDRHHLAVSGWVGAAERGLPGPITTAPIGERQWDRHVRLWARDRFAWQGMKVDLGLGTHAAELRYRNPQLELDEVGTNVGHFLEGTITRSSRTFQLTFGGRAAYDRAMHPSRRPASETNGAAFLAGALAVRSASFYPAVRLDARSAPEAGLQTSVSPRLGMTTSVPGVRRLRAKASVGRTFRAPTFNERYWRPGGNADLVPEQGWHGDVGLAYVRRRIAVELSAFGSSLQDEIMWLITPAGHYAARNLRRTRSMGVELSGNFTARLEHDRHVNGGFVVTFTDATDRSDPQRPSYGHQLRYVPVLQAKSHASIHVGVVSLDLSTRYAGRRYVTTDGTQWVDPYVVADAQVRIRQTVAGAAVTLAIAIENALNAHYAVIQHYPMPPRHVRLTLNIESNRQGNRP